jgi:hypothetical protein
MQANVHYNCDCNSNTLLCILIGLLAFYIVVYPGIEPTGGSGMIAGSFDVSLSELLLASPEAAYLDSVSEAQRADLSMVHRQLVSISKHNPTIRRRSISGIEHVLVATWSGWKGYERAVQTASSSPARVHVSKEVWVSAVPELAAKCRAYRSHTDAVITRRLEQILGLPPGVRYQWVVEIWVPPSRLFRPCPDPDITDHECNLDFPEPIDTRTDGVTDLHRAWVNERIARVYNRNVVTDTCDISCISQNVYPWTRMGYTYDWGSACAKANARLRATAAAVAPSSASSEDLGTPLAFALEECYGVSEFVILPNSTIYVERIVPSVAYCREPVEQAADRNVRQF